MLTRYACTAAELSCVIGNIFAELSPPCAACGAEVLQITGTTVTGNAATLTVTEAGFDFDGCADDTAIIERMRKGRCIYAKTGAGAERTDGIQRGWRGHAEKGNSYHLIRRTDQYYNSLMKSKEAAQCQKH